MKRIFPLPFRPTKAKEEEEEEPLPRSPSLFCPSQNMSLKPYLHSAACEPRLLLLRFFFPDIEVGSERKASFFSFSGSTLCTVLQYCTQVEKKERNEKLVGTIRRKNEVFALSLFFDPVARDMGVFFFLFLLLPLPPPPAVSRNVPFPEGDEKGNPPSSYSSSPAAAAAHRFSHMYLEFGAIYQYKEPPPTTGASRCKGHTEIMFCIRDSLVGPSSSLSRDRLRPETFACTIKCRG